MLVFDIGRRRARPDSVDRFQFPALIHLSLRKVAAMIATRLVSSLSFLLALSFLIGSTTADDAVLSLFKAGPTTDNVIPRTTKIESTDDGLTVTNELGHDWPAVCFDAPDEIWDLSGYMFVTIDLTGAGDRPVEINARVMDAEHMTGADGTRGSITLAPGEKGSIKIRLTKRMGDEIRKKLYGMRGYPGGYDERKGIDVSRVARVELYLARPKETYRFIVRSIRAEGVAPQIDDADFFPMIDQFGQYMHAKWPGKIGSIDELRAQIDAEAKELAAKPGPAQWDEWGGWADGPQLEATGRFRTEKVDGRWWLVDPSGRLFWSHGVDCVRTGNATTPITDREHYFAALPPDDGRFASCYSSASWAPHGYYNGRGKYRTFNFTQQNLILKYGDEWWTTTSETAHRRLKSWGMNTIANWSDSAIYKMRKTPYTVTVSAYGKSIEGSTGYWGKFPDPFDPSLGESIRRSMEQKKRDGTAGDPWCLGYFVSNELAWGNDVSLATATLASPADQPCKLAMIGDLKAKYKTIEKLNAAWETSHESFDALKESTTPPSVDKARDDLEAFTTRIAREYFRVCRDGVKAVDPDGLYLGCRFAWANDFAVRASFDFCDVVSFNKYRRTVADLKPPTGCDRPLIIGEFHFGALDRGMLHTGLVPTANQNARAGAYRDYLTGALKNPYLVGTHWFQYGDQATTGRGDGENYQIGLVNVVDVPYPETIGAVREIGYSMYKTRSDAEKDDATP